jgi:hypothetical protein
MLTPIQVGLTLNWAVVAVGTLILALAAVGAMTLAKWTLRTIRRISRRVQGG